MDEVSRLSAMVAVGDRDGAGQLVGEYARRRGFAALVTELFAPLLASLDESRGPDGTYPLAQVYVASKVMEDALDQFGDDFAAGGPVGAEAGVAVIGNIEDDCHALGRRLVGVFLRAAGWEVHDLGIDVEPDQFVETARRVGAHVVGVSAMLHRTAEGIARVRQGLDAAGLSPRVKLAVGGAVFRLRPELVDQVGGDGSAAHAVQAPALFAQLRRAGEQTGSPS